MNSTPLQHTFRSVMRAVLNLVTYAGSSSSCLYTCSRWANWGTTIEALTYFSPPSNSVASLHGRSSPTMFVSLSHSWFVSGGWRGFLVRVYCLIDSLCRQMRSTIRKVLFQRVGTSGIYTEHT